MSITMLYNPVPTVPLAKFLTDLRFEFQDLPDELFLTNIIRAARTMAQEGDIDVRHTVIHTTPHVTRYLLPLPDTYELNKILSASAPPRKPLELLRSKPKTPVYSRGYCWYDDIDKTIHFKNYHYHAPVTFNISVVPTYETCELPECFYYKYLDVLQAGVKYNILRMLNKPWTNLQLALAYERAFKEGISNITLDNHMHQLKGIMKIDFGGGPCGLF